MPPQEFRKLAMLAWTAFTRHGLGERQFANFDQDGWRSLVLYHWAGLAPIDETSEAYRVNLNEAKLSRVRLVERWNREFPSMALDGGVGFIERDVRNLVRTIASLHSDLLE